MNIHPAGRREAGWYEIRLDGRLHERWSAWFEDMTLTTISGGGSDSGPDARGSAGQGVITVLRGPVADQAALHGILARLRDSGMPLISVARVEQAAAEDAGGATGSGR